MRASRLARNDVMETGSDASDVGRVRETIALHCCRGAGGAPYFDRDATIETVRALIREVSRAGAHLPAASIARPAQGYDLRHIRRRRDAATMGDARR